MWFNKWRRWSKFALFATGQKSELPWWLRCNVWDLGLIPGLGRFLGKGNGNPLQCCCQEKHMDGGAWWATVHGVIRIRHHWVTNTSRGEGSDAPEDSWEASVARHTSLAIKKKWGVTLNSLHTSPPRIYMMFLWGMRGWWSPKPAFVVFSNH